ncbi:substrate-binding domain-containing protein [Actinomadura macrotermitis]|uniref:VWFA domain-containing protein n=1 Tax=Actinomadura macrotermitis TaxID=2585200 RepID=A0A7K0C099_9ACTN|nr:hypothetical protein [Actinomadura macrotermitis]
MSGRHRNDFPEGTPGDGEHDPSRPLFGPANDGSSDWFGPRDSQSPPVTPGPGVPPPGASGAQQVPGPGESSETPEWFTPRGPGEEPAYGAGGFSGASDAGGYGLGRPVPQGAAGDDRYGEGVRRPGDAEAAAFGAGAASAASGGYGDYDTVSRSDERPAGFFGGRAGGSGGGDYGGGPGGSGGYGGGSGEYGRRKKKRSAAALIGPMAGAVGLALLLGVGVYAFAEGGGDCDGDGAIALGVSAAPDIEPVVTKAAGRFNDAKHKVSGKCVKAVVTKVPAASVATLLSGQGVPTDGNKRPDVWIPDSSMWASLVRSSPKGKDAVRSTKTSVAASPLVIALPQTLAGRLKQEGVTTTPSWDNLLKAAGGTAGGGVTKNQMIQPGTVRLLVPEPSTNAAGMTALMVTNALLTNDPNRESIFTGIVRTIREATVPTVADQFKLFRKNRPGRQPVAFASEQAVWQYNKTGPAEPAVALYPIEGTMMQDYPFTVTTDDGDKAKAAQLLEQAMNTETTRTEVRDLGFRSPEGKAPASFGAKLGVSPARPRQLTAPRPAEVAQVMQAWSKLSLGLRILTLIDVSGSMSEQVAPNTTRLQATARVAQGGLTMMSDDTELGIWQFSTKMRGDLDYREVVSVGPLNERIGSTSRRNLVLSQLGQLQPKPTGDTGLYDSVLAAYKYMKRSYKPEFGNSILLLTDGANDDKGGPTLNETLARLRKETDPNKPIQVNMIGFGPGVDRGELEKIAGVTNGSVQVASTPQEISKIFLKMLSRRIKQ